MHRRLPVEDEYEYEDDEGYEETYRHRPRRYKKESDHEKKRWDKENHYDRGRDYDDHR